MLGTIRGKLAKLLPGKPDKEMVYGGPSQAEYFQAENFGEKVCASDPETTKVLIEIPPHHAMVLDVGRELDDERKQDLIEYLRDWARIWYAIKLEPHLKDPQLQGPK